MGGYGGGARSGSGSEGDTGVVGGQCWEGVREREEERGREGRESEEGRGVVMVGCWLVVMVVVLWQSQICNHSGNGGGGGGTPSRLQLQPDGAPHPPWPLQHPGRGGGVGGVVGAECWEGVGRRGRRRGVGGEGKRGGVRSGYGGVLAGGDGGGVVAVTNMQSQWQWRWRWRYTFSASAAA